MKTIQEHLKEANKKEIIESFFATYKTINVFKLKKGENKLTVEELITKRIKESLSTAFPITQK